MRIRINGCDNELLIDNQTVNIIETRDIKLFRKILENINNKVNGIENNEIFILDEKEGEIPFSKEVTIIFDLFNFDVSSKRIITKIYSKIQEDLDYDEEIELNDEIVKLRNILIKHANELPFNFMIKEDIKISELLKLFEFKVDDTSYSSLLEKIELIIDILTTLKISRFLVIPNLKDYLIDEELIYLYKYSLYNNINLIIIQNGKKEKIKYEKKLYIDENFDDFIE